MGTHAGPKMGFTQGFIPIRSPGTVEYKLRKYGCRYSRNTTARKLYTIGPLRDQLNESTSDHLAQEGGT